MTGPQLETLAVSLLTTAEAMRCPCCGTINARCCVWAGGPGHTLGMHDARIKLAQQALIDHRTDLIGQPPLLPRSRRQPGQHR